jgi:hypothetical protein
VKVTVPLGMPAPGATGATVAVYVTSWPTTGDEGFDEMAVVVCAFEIVSATAPEVDEEKLPSVA